MANDYGYFGSGSTGYAHYKQAFDRILAVQVVAAGIIMVVEAAPAVERCCLSSRWP